MWLKIVELSVRNLMLNKLRSLLTMLGTILGVSSVIAMLAIGEGSKRKAVEQIRQLGAANVIIRSVKPGEDDRRDASAGNSKTSFLLSVRKSMVAFIPERKNGGTSSGIKSTLYTVTLLTVSDS